MWCKGLRVEVFRSFLRFWPQFAQTGKKCLNDIAGGLREPLPSAVTGGYRGRSVNVSFRFSFGHDWPQEERVGPVRVWAGSRLAASGFANKIADAQPARD